MKKIKEDVSYGIYDRPAPKPEDAESDELTLGEELPVEPNDQMMSAQLSVQRPPIEDEEFTPGSIEELSRSASAIAQLVPSSQVEFFYRALHKILDKASDNASSSEVVSTADSEESQGEMSESAIRKKVRKTLLEILSQSDVDELDAYRGRSYDTGGVDYFGDDIESPKEPEAVKQKSDGTVSLEQIAAQFGYSGASGVRQEIQRLTDRLKYFVTNVKEEDLNSLIDYAAGEYVDTMDAFGILEDDESELLRNNLGKVKSADGFRFFFVSSFIMPAYREVTRNSTKALNTEIEKLNVPSNLHQAIFNQVTGAASSGNIAKKLASLAKKGEITREEALSLVRKIESAIPRMNAAAEKSDDLVARSLEKWQGMSKANKKRLLDQALSMTSGVN